MFHHKFIIVGGTEATIVVWHGGTRRREGVSRFPFSPRYTTRFPLPSPSITTEKIEIKPVDL